MNHTQFQNSANQIRDSKSESNWVVIRPGQGRCSHPLRARVRFVFYFTHSASTQHKKGGEITAPGPSAHPCLCNPDRPRRPYPPSDGQDRPRSPPGRFTRPSPVLKPFLGSSTIISPAPRLFPSRSPTLEAISSRARRLARHLAVLTMPT
jgi:hypothetical protein